MNFNTVKFYKCMLWTCIAVITIVALTPAPYAAETGFSDKLNHIAAFMVLSFLALKVYPGRFLVSGLWLLLYGIIIEAVQILMPGRSCSVTDLGADVLGIFAGIFFTMITGLPAKRKEKKYLEKSR